MFSMFTGKAPVSRIFWLGVAIFIFPIIFGLGYVFFLSHTSPDPQVQTLTKIGHVVLSALTALYFFFMTKSLFRSAHRNRSPRISGWAAIFITALLVPLAAHFTFDPWFYKRQVLQALSNVPASPELMAEVETIKTTLPRPMTKSIEIQSAQYQNRELVFHLVGKGNLAQNAVQSTEASLAKTLSTEEPYCSELAEAFKRGLWSARYEVRYDNAVLIARLSPDHCAEGWEPTGLTIRN